MFSVGLVLCLYVRYVCVFYLCACMIDSQLRICRIPAGRRVVSYVYMPVGLPPGPVLIPVEQVLERLD